MAQRKTTRRKKTTKKTDYTKLFIRKVIGMVQDSRSHRIAGLACWLFALFMFIAFVSYFFTWHKDQSEVFDSVWSILSSPERAHNGLGRFGSFLSHLFIYKWFGLASFIFIIGFMLTGSKLLFKDIRYQLAKVYKYSFLSIPLLATILSFLFTELSGFPFGGGIGQTISNWLNSFFGPIGAGLFLLFTLAVVLILIFDIDIIEDTLKNTFLGKPFVWFKKKMGGSPTLEPSMATVGNTHQTLGNQEAKPLPNKTIPLQPLIDENPPQVEPGQQIPLEFDKNVQNKLDQEAKTEDLLLDIVAPVTNEKGNSKVVREENNDNLENDFDPTLELSKYEYPTIDLLESYGRDLYGKDKLQVDMEELELNKNQIVQTLSNYNIEISRIQATPGPTITLYEIVPAPGVRISKIRNLEDDIALSLAALGIRIIAPMPGKGTIGIEVPNQKKEIVSLRGILASKKFQHSKMDLPVALGKTISDENFVADLAKMPHLLLAGATGQGKSVCLNSILVSLLYKKHPAEMKFVMIDPKKVELYIYNVIEKHFLAKLPFSEDAIVTDTKQVINTLNSLCIEMDMRYDLLKNAHVRNIREYNTKFKKRRLNPLKGHRYLPYIVLVIDEFADLIMTAGKEIEMPLARLAQLARAVGVHLVIATQRPTVNIITGTIKANFPVRIAFRVTSKIDSRTILDVGGANQLIGRGDMLLSMGGNVIRLQGAFVDTPEVDRVAQFVEKQQSYPEAFLLPEYGDDENELMSEGDVEFDEKFEEAARVIVMHQQGSTSLIQRKLKLGYNRAGRIMDQLEYAGIVGPNVGSKAREVYVSDDYELDIHLQKIKNN